MGPAIGVHFHCRFLYTYYYLFSRSRTSSGLYGAGNKMLQQLQNAYVYLQVWFVIISIDASFSAGLSRSLVRRVMVRLLMQRC